MHFNLVMVKIMVRVLISAAFWVVALIRGGTYHDMSVDGAALIRRRQLFEGRHLLEETRYLRKIMKSCFNFYFCLKLHLNNLQI